MNVLFVCSGNDINGISAIVKSQGESLVTCNINVDYFTINNKGILGYIYSIIKLNKYLSKNDYDIMHAHYALSGWVALFGKNSSIPIVVSYMGCDTYGDYNEKGKLVPLSIISIFLGKLLQPFPKAIIVKSPNLEKYIYFKKKTHLIPNGVNLKKIFPFSSAKAKSLLLLSQDKKYVLFLGNKNDKRKNFKLLYEAKTKSKISFEILYPYPIEHDKIPLYLNAADVFVLTSYNEGSPNVIKEAMACNCPIVATDVGDIKWVFGDNSPGCYLSSFDPFDLSNKIIKAIEFSEKTGRTNGRQRIVELGLDSVTIAQRIINIYKSVLQ